MTAKVLVFVFLWWCGAAAARRHRDVVTTQGAARGYLSPAPVPHFAFLGLPYARPPTRLHRFKAPSPPPAWDGIFEATHRVTCPQRDQGSEHCLLINVFVPAGAARALPVVMLVHDGAFREGWGAFVPPPRLLNQDYVVVTFNYRLGALGFLCLGTETAPGNAGLKDQVAALYWVNRNIASFGGNPHDVTLHGKGAGAISIQLFLLSALTEGLVNRVILESGSALSPTAMMYDPFATALNFALSLGYDDEGSIEDLERFYQQLPISALVDTSTIFLPCVENYSDTSLLERDSLDILKAGDFDRVPLLIVYSADAKKENFSELPENLVDVLPKNLEFYSESEKDKVAEVIKAFYFEEYPLSEDILQSYEEFMADVFMEYPVVKFSILYAARSSLPVYLMRYSYKARKDERDGPAANDILNIFEKEDRWEDDEEAGQRLQTLWNNFIKLGDPTPLTTSLIPVVWQPVYVETGEDLDLSHVSCLDFHQELRMQEVPTGQRLAFWDRIYNKFYRLHVFNRPNNE